MAEEVTKRSNGGINMIFHGGTLLGKELEIMDAVRSGNIAMGTPVAPGAAPAADAAGGTQIGKRYVNAAGDLELLCTKPGAGTLAIGGVALAIKGAKPLPSSD